MKKKQKRVEYVRAGLASSYKDHIEINEKLKNDKPLRDYIVKHELGHSDSFDLTHELPKRYDLKMLPRLLKFILRNPETWKEFLPFYKKGDTLVYDINMIILYAVSALLFGALAFILILIF